MNAQSRLTPGPIGRQVGLSLIEMLIALLVLSFGLLGIAGLQAQSLKNNQTAYLRSQATILAYEIMDRMRANRAAAVSGSYDFGDVTATVPTAVAAEGCSGGEAVASCDLKTWRSRLAQTLPRAAGAIDCNVDTLVCTVAVWWDDTRGAADPLQIRISTEI